MNLTEYYRELNDTAKDLERSHPDGVVHVTSLRNREKNSVAGKTLSAGCRNAARVITDGTHRVATLEEINAFAELQEKNRVVATLSEQRKRQQYIVLVDESQPANAGLLGPPRAASTASHVRGPFTKSSSPAADVVEG
jgi:hypothetical protein